MNLAIYLPSEKSHTPFLSDGRGATSRLVTMCPLFNPTNRPLLAIGGAITYTQHHKTQHRGLLNHQNDTKMKVRLLQQVVVSIIPLALFGEKTLDFSSWKMEGYHRTVHLQKTLTVGFYGVHNYGVHQNYVVLEASLSLFGPSFSNSC